MWYAVWCPCKLKQALHLIYTDKTVMQVVVNLYPFRQTVTASTPPSFETGIENIDIGAPCLSLCHDPCKEPASAAAIQVCSGSCPLESWCSSCRWCSGTKQMQVVPAIVPQGPSQASHALHTPHVKDPSCSTAMPLPLPQHPQQPPPSSTFFPFFCSPFFSLSPSGRTGGPAMIRAAPSAAAPQSTIVVTICHARPDPPVVAQAGQP